jgi:hypothetical protein
MPLFPLFPSLLLCGSFNVLYKTTEQQSNREGKKEFLTKTLLQLDPSRYKLRSIDNPGHVTPDDRGQSTGE